MPYLSLSIWVPIAAGLAVLAVGRDRDAAAARWIALAGAIAGLVVTLPLWLHFRTGTSDMQFVEFADGFRGSTSTTSSAWMASRCCSCCSTA
jgi:NADH-quinone oxidoreductase subunit M